MRGGPVAELMGEACGDKSDKEAFDTRTGRFIGSSLLASDPKGAVQVG